MKEAAKCVLIKKPSEATLQWQAGEYSQSPFYPYWKITTNSGTWIVTQEGKVVKTQQLELA